MQADIQHLSTLHTDFQVLVSSYAYSCSLIEAFRLLCLKDALLEWNFKTHGQKEAIVSPLLALWDSWRLLSDLYPSRRVS